MRYLIVAGTLTILVGAWLGVAMMPAAPGVTKANYNRIELGMTKAEVDAIFDAPSTHLWRQMGSVSYWNQDNGSLAIIEFHNETVVFGNWISSTETVLEKLRRWLRL